MSFRFVVGLIIFGIVAFVATRMMVLDNQNDKLTTKLTDSTAVLRRTRARAGQLTERVGDLRLDSSNFQGALATVAKERSDAAIKVNEMQNNLNRTLSEKNAVVARYSAKAKKEAADRPVAGVGKINTTERDSVLNGDVAVLKEQYRYVHDTLVPALQNEVAYEKGQHQKFKKKAEDLESDLETELNRKASTKVAIQNDLYNYKKSKQPLGIKNNKAKKELERTILSRLNSPQ